MSKLSPILKWAGGKRQLLPQIIPLIPDNINRYYEPFVGAGAVLLELQPRRAVINDMNTELINVYQIIKEQPAALIELLTTYDELHCNDFYYQIRNVDRDNNSFAQLTPLEKAARTIYLNRTCYNGLYRVNKKGYFNTPIGHNTTIQIVNAQGIQAISEYLNSNEVIIRNTDYQSAVRWIRNTDFVFLDPPYYPINRDYFTRYDASPFGVAEQIQLRDFCDRLNQRGIRFIQTNSDCEEVRTLYRAYHQETVDVNRFINADANGRRATELIITNY